MNDFINNKYYLAGFIQTHRPDWRHRQRPDNAASNLIAVTEGVIYMEEAGIKYTVRQGEVLLLEHGLPSMGYRASEVPTAFYYLLFNGPIPKNIPKHFAPQYILRIYELYEMLLKYKKVIGYPSEGMDYIARLLLMETSWQSLTGKEHHPNFIMGSLLDWIKKNRDRNITVNEIARQFFYSSDYISRLFYQYEGIYLKDYILSVRLSYIEELLSDPQYSLSQVAEICGFVSIHSFLKFYKYHRKITPTEFRQGQPVL
jgi:AraC-like DNA-binding protein